MFGTNDKSALDRRHRRDVTRARRRARCRRSPLVADRPGRLRRLRLPGRVGPTPAIRWGRRRRRSSAAVLAVVAGIAAFSVLVARWLHAAPWQRRASDTVAAPRSCSASVAWSSSPRPPVPVTRRLRRSPRSVESARPQPPSVPRPISSTPPAGHATVHGQRALSPYITPNDDFYRIDTVADDAAGSTPTAGTSASTVSSSNRSSSATTSCSASTASRRRSPCSASPTRSAAARRQRRVAGRAAGDLLERAGVQTGATQIVGRSVDGWTAGFPTELATDGRVAMVAYAMNGEPLPVEHGYPARLVVAGLYGYVSATKWLDRDRADDVGGLRRVLGAARVGQGRADQDGVADRRAARFDGAGTGSAGDRRRGVGPRPGDRARRGAGRRRASGRSAELGDVTSDNTWVQWRVRVGRDGGRPRRAASARPTATATPRPTTSPRPHPTARPAGRAGRRARPLIDNRRRSHEPHPTGHCCRPRAHRAGGVRRRR